MDTGLTLCYNDSISPPIFINVHGKGGTKGARISEGPSHMRNEFNFIKKSLDALPVPAAGERKDYYDSQVRGLLIQVTGAGSRTFYLRRKINGRSARIFIGKYPDVSIEGARGKAIEHLAAIAKGDNPQDKIQKAPQGEQPTLGILFDCYIERHAKKTRKTWPIMLKDFDRNLGKWRNREAAHICNHDVEKLHCRLREKSGPYAANRTIQLLRAIYNKAITWKLTTDNPVKGITLFPEKSRERFLSRDEVRRLFEALKVETHEDIKDFVWLSLLTGARKSNVLAMRWRDIDFDAGTWTIPETKNGTSQTLSLTGGEIAILAKRKDNKIESDYVFPGPDKSRPWADPKKRWKALLSRAQISDCTLHDLRRNLGSWMASENVNVALIKSALNHKDMKTTLAVYARTAKDAERQGRELAHTAMLRAAGLQPESDNVIVFRQSSAG